MTEEERNTAMHEVREQTDAEDGAHLEIYDPKRRGASESSVTAVDLVGISPISTTWARRSSINTDYVGNAGHGHFDIAGFRRRAELSKPKRHLSPDLTTIPTAVQYRSTRSHELQGQIDAIRTANTKHLDAARHGQSDVSEFRCGETSASSSTAVEGSDRSPDRGLQQISVLGSLESAEPGTPVEEKSSNNPPDMLVYRRGPPGEILETPNFTNNDTPSRLVEEFSAAIKARDSLRARMLFEQDRASIVSQHKYNWTEELLDAGYSTIEIVDLMIEEETQSPWIYYDPPGLKTAGLDISLHQSGCIHGTLHGKIDGTLQSNAKEPPQYCQSTSRLVAEMCGLAGLIPFTGGPSTWNGNAIFIPDPQCDSAFTAAVFYGSQGSTSLTKSELQDLVQTSHDALGRALALAVWLQKSALICNRFTILTQCTPKLVEVVSIRLKLVRRLQESLQLVLEASEKAIEHSLDVCAQRSRAILILVFPGILLDDKCSTWQYTVDCCALAVQSICIGLLGFSNAHLGKWHPFFLEHDLTEVRLCGIDGPLCQRQKFSVRLAELSCIGDMLRSPARVFVIGDAAVTHSSKCDLETSIVSLLEMWGPGQVIIDRDVLTEKNVCLVKLGDGVLYKTTDRSRKTLHWARGSDPKEPHDQECFYRDEKLVIGASTPLANLNTDCPLSHTLTPHQNLNRISTNSMIHELGTWAAYWEQTERQAGLQGGNYIFGVFNLTWVKNGSETIKKRKLGGAQFDLQFLEAPWGVQVSACTGVAQRVPLREVVADAMVPMVEAWGNRPDEWTELLNVHGIVDQFRSPSFVSWFIGLGSNRRMAVLKIAEHVLAQLSYTGFNDRGELVLAYPVPEDAFACIHIPSKKGRLWTRILKDSQECATFACITSRCLETPDHKCRNSSNAGWDEPVLLVTAVCQYHRAQSGAWEKMHLQRGLQNGNTYWMGEPGNEMEFKARLYSPPNPSSAKVLEICASQIPAKIRQRMIATRLLAPGRSVRLQERRRINEEYAEDVFVSSDQPRPWRKTGLSHQRVVALSGMERRRNR